MRAPRINNTLDLLLRKSDWSGRNLPKMMMQGMVTVAVVIVILIIKAKHAIRTV